jgi:hypothetical protein
MVDKNKYQEFRALGSTAKNAYMQAKYIENVSNTIPWKDSKDRSGKEMLAATMERDGFDVYFCVEHDYDHHGNLDESDLRGTFTDTWEPGVVNNPREFTRTGERRNKYLRYFLPQCTYKEHFDWLRKTHSRGEADRLAREYVQRDLKHALSAGEDWSPVGVRVRVSKAGIKLGEASLWGLSTEDGKEHYTEVGLDALPEALHEAKEKLAALCSCPETQAPNP